MRMGGSTDQKLLAIDFPSLLKNPAVATAAFCEPRPTLTPAPAAAPHGVSLFADGGIVDGDSNPATMSGATGVLVPGRSTVAGVGGASTTAGTGGSGSAR
jgi:hypothetical protein